ncbi:cbb3-type cytochrome oxidase subunit 3 [Stenotrophomonas sp. JC08]|uniref:cbb3-type cytochrome oxidase subunit 3 n=1 Tax=Stenotrophomonas sp. JC08 TaxID=3445779 RepID=UPI003FA26EA3
MISGIVTALLLVLFIGGWIWAWSPKRKREFEDAARLPLEDDNEQYSNGGEHRC